VWIPYQQYLAEALPSNRGPTMRTANYVGSLLDTVALTNSNFMVYYGSIGEKQLHGLLISKKKKKRQEVPISLMFFVFLIHGRPL
jgi:hypothetical protein